MIERDGKTYTAVCDYCGKALAGYMSYRSANDATQKLGWKLGQVNDWRQVGVSKMKVYYCPDCEVHYKAEVSE